MTIASTKDGFVYRLDNRFYADRLAIWEEVAFAPTYTVVDDVVVLDEPSRVGYQGVLSTAAPPSAGNLPYYNWYWSLPVNEPRFWTGFVGTTELSATTDLAFDTDLPAGAYATAVLGSSDGVVGYVAADFGVFPAAGTITPDTLGGLRPVIVQFYEYEPDVLTIIVALEAPASIEDQKNYSVAFLVLNGGTLIDLAPDAVFEYAPGSYAYPFGAEIEGMSAPAAGDTVTLSVSLVEASP